jgi:nitroreductase
MELTEVLRHRQMVRSFADRDVELGVVNRLVRDALRSPSAGNTGGTAFLLLAGGDETAQYWRHATTEDWRGRSARFPGLSRAPVILLSLAWPAAYVRRYGEPDKVAAGLGPGSAGAAGPVGEAAWPVPYWFGDAAFATMAVLLGAVDTGLGAAFLGNFRGEEPLLGALGVPDGWRLFGAVLLGHPDGNDHRSASLGRQGPRPADRVHRGRW